MLTRTPSASQPTQQSRPTPTPAMHSRAAVAAMLGLSTQTIDRLIRSGRLHAVRIGRRVLIPQHAIDALLTSQ